MNQVMPWSASMELIELSRTRKYQCTDRHAVCICQLINGPRQSDDRRWIREVKNRAISLQSAKVAKAVAKPSRFRESSFEIAYSETSMRQILLFRSGQ